MLTENISDLDDRSIETSQSEMRKKKKIKNGGSIWKDVAHMENKADE